MASLPAVECRCFHIYMRGLTEFSLPFLEQSTTKYPDCFKNEFSLPSYLLKMPVMQNQGWLTEQHMKVENKEM